MHMLVVSRSSCLAYFCLHSMVLWVLTDLSLVKLYKWHYWKCYFFPHGKFLRPLLAEAKITNEEGYSYFCSAPFYFHFQFSSQIASTQTGCFKCEQSLSWYKPEESQLPGNVDVCRTLKLFLWPMSIDVNTPAVNWGVLTQHILETARQSHAAGLFSRALTLQVHFAGQALFAYAFHAFQTQFQSIQGHSGGP